MRRAIALLLAAALTACAAPQRETALEFHNVSTEVAYLGQDSCRECHLDKFGTYIRTGMGRALYPMSPEEVVEDFTVDNEFVHEQSGVRYRMEEVDGKYFQTEFVLDSKGNELVSERHEMVFVIGSNNHCRSYVTLQDEKWFQLPACWYPAESKWEMCPGYEGENEHFHRELGIGCTNCHNGVMRLVEGERNKYHEPIAHGIGCERCHGPGELHVAHWHDNPDSPRGEHDPTIVNPRSLPKEERFEVCVQCHLGDAKATELVLRAGRSWQEYRPGMKITEVLMPFQYEDQTQYDFGLSAQVDRLILSKCYTETEGQIECLTCHNPHVSVYSDQRPDDYFRLKCLSCHQVEACPAPDAERQATTPAKDDCIQCHMRKAEADDQRFAVFTDHWIRRDVRDMQRDERERHVLKPIFPERLAALPDGEAAYYEARAGFLLARDAPEEDRQRIWNEAEDNFEKAIAAGFDNVESWFFLGKTRFDMRKRDEAFQAYRKAVEHDPTHHDAVYALAQEYVARGEMEKGLELFQGMLERDPEDVMALAEVGRVYAETRRIDEAIPYYEKAIFVEPWTASLRMHLGMLLASKGRFGEAALHGEDAARLDPDNPDVWEFYAKVMSAAGQEEKAREGRRWLASLRE